MDLFRRNIKNAPKVPFNLDGRIMFSSEKVEIIHLALNPGDRIEKHEQPFDVLFYVAEGTGKLEIDDEILQASKDTLIEVKAGRNRGWSNTGDNALQLLVIKLLNS